MKLNLLSVNQIISWANPSALLNDVMFLGKRPELPYIKKEDNLFYYFKRTESHDYELLMTSLHDLESLH